MSAAPLGAAEGEQTFVCRPKPAARFCVDAGRQPKERFPHTRMILFLITILNRRYRRPGGRHPQAGC